MAPRSRPMTRKPGKWPKIRSRQTIPVSPWVSVIAREVEFSADGPPQLYHAVEQADYVAIVALTKDGRIPLVRQYRPVLEGFSWELPAGLVDGGEIPPKAAAGSCSRRPGFPRAPSIAWPTRLRARGVSTTGFIPSSSRPARAPASSIRSRASA